MNIRWSGDPLEECQQSFTAADGTACHVCVKHQSHRVDETDDEHQCCCGKTDWVTR